MNSKTEKNNKKLLSTYKFDFIKYTNKETALKQNTYHIHRALTQQIQELRKGNANTKTRSEVKGSGRKPWKQKGTGKARAGSIRSPLWKGGGVIFGPKTKTYKKKINKKEKMIAIKDLILNREKRTRIIQPLNSIIYTNKSKLLLEYLEHINIPKNEKILFIVKQKDINTYLSLRNFKNIKYITPNQLNISILINTEHICIEKETLMNIKPFTVI